MFSKGSNDFILLLKRFDMNAQARYSITKPFEALQVSTFICSELTKDMRKPEDCIITDATAGVGGDTINFAKYFKYVNAVEIDPDTFQRLNNNIRSFGLRNIYTYLGNYIKLYKNFIQDLIYIDFPWGGTAYKYKQEVQLYLNEDNECKPSTNECKPSTNESKATVLDIIELLFKKWPEVLIFIKVPFNVSLDSFKHYITSESIIFNKAGKPSFKVLKITRTLRKISLNILEV